MCGRYQPAGSLTFERSLASWALAQGSLTGQGGFGTKPPHIRGEPSPTELTIQPAPEKLHQGQVQFETSQNGPKSFLTLFDKLRYRFLP